jgi:hypothetical protein
MGKDLQERFRKGQLLDLTGEKRLRSLTVEVRQ